MSNLVSYVFLSSDGKLKIYFEAIMAAVYCNKQQHQYMTKKYHCLLYTSDAADE